MLRRERDRWEVEIDVIVATGVTSRKFDAATCSDAVDAMALIVATAINPGGEAAAAASREAEPRTQDEPADQPEVTPAVPAPPPAAPVGPQSEHRPAEAADHPADDIVIATAPPVAAPAGAASARPRLRLQGAAHAGLAFGLIPRVGADLGASLGVAIPSAEFAVVAHAVTPRTVRNGGDGGRFTLWTGGVRACGRSARRLQFGGCGAVEVGGVSAVGVGFAVNDRATALWSGGVVSGWVGYRFGLATVRLEPGVVVGFLRPSFGGENTGFDHQLGRVGFRLNLAVHFEVP